MQIRVRKIGFLTRRDQAICEEQGALRILISNKLSLIACLYCLSSFKSKASRFKTSKNAGFLTTSL
jgi:hypothetical protein